MWCLVVDEYIGEIWVVDGVEFDIDMLWVLYCIIVGVLEDFVVFCNNIVMVKLIEYMNYFIKKYCDVVFWVVVELFV